MPSTELGRPVAACTAILVFLSDWRFEEEYGSRADSDFI